MAFSRKPLNSICKEADMECNHPEAYVSIMGRYRVCNLCGAKLPLVQAAEKKPVKTEPKKGAKANARK